VDHEVRETADLYVLTARPVLQAVQLYRDEIIARQEVNATFDTGGHP